MRLKFAVWIVFAGLASPVFAQPAPAASAPPGGFSAPTTSQMRSGIFTKLGYDAEYFSSVLKLQADGKRDTRLSKDDWEKEIRRSRVNVPLLKKLFSEREQYEKGKPLSMPPRDDAHRVYANLIALLNMLQAFDQGDFQRVLTSGERVVVSAKTDLGVVRSEDSRYYLNLFREYFWFMAAAHYRMGHDREAIAWLSRIDTDTNVQELKKELAKIDTRSTSERLAALYKKSVAILPLVDKKPSPENDWVGRGFVEVYTTDLQRFTNLLIVERSNVEKVLTEIKLAQLGLTDEKNTVKLATQLAAGTMIRGSYEARGDSFELALELVDGDDGKVLAHSNGKVPKDQLFKAGREVLLALLRDAGWLSEDAAEELRVASVPSPDTIRGLLEARLLMASKSGQAKEIYKKAIKDSPEYAKAFADMQKAFEGINPLVAVMPFFNVSGREEDQWMAFGTSEALNSDLPILGFTLVERLQLTKLLKEEDISQVLGDAEVHGMAKRLGADFVVVGSTLHAGKQMRIDCRFVDVSTGIVVQTFSADGTEADFTGILARLSTAIGLRYNVKLTDEELKKLAGNKLTNEEFQRFARERLLAEKMVRKQAREEQQVVEKSEGRTPLYVASAAVVGGAALSITGFVLASQSNGNTAYIEALQQLARRQEDITLLAAQRSQSSTATTAWTVAGTAGAAIAVGSAAYLVYKLFTAPPPMKQKVEVVESKVSLVPSVSAGPTGATLSIHGSF
jgi:TolB-like protein